MHLKSIHDIRYFWHWYSKKEKQFWKLLFVCKLLAFVSLNKIGNFEQKAKYTLLIGFWIILVKKTCFHIFSLHDANT